MAIKFNPLTGNFDFTGSGGGGGSAFFAGEVATYADLPLDGTAALNSRWLVRTNSGTWPFSSYKQSGIYIRTATVGSSRDNDYKLTDTSFFDVMSDAAFLLFDDGDATKNLKFQLSGITTGTTRTLTAPNASGTIALTSDIPTTFAASAITSGTFDNARINFAAPAAIGGTTAAAGTFTTLTANNGTLTASAPVLDLAQTWNASGTTFTGLRFNVTNTASAVLSNLVALQVGGTDRFRVRNDGFVTIDPSGTNNAVAASTSTLMSLFGVVTRASGQFAWTSGLNYTDTTDVILVRDGAAGTLAQRNSTNVQESRLYSTFTSSTNYQRMTIKSVRQTLSALSGASATTTGTFIPDGAVVVGVTTRVTTLLAGATGYTIGDGTDADRWGDITGTAVGTTSDNINWTAGTIECFTAGGNITLTAKTANFTAGAIEISVFYLAGEAD
jgi:hypothetical protein